MKISENLRGLLFNKLHSGLMVVPKGADKGKLDSSVQNADLKVYILNELGLFFIDSGLWMIDKKELYVTYDNLKSLRRAWKKHVNSLKDAVMDRTVTWYDFETLKEYGIEDRWIASLQDIPSSLSAMGLRMFVPTYRQITWWKYILASNPDMHPLDVYWFAYLYYHRDLASSINGTDPYYDDIEKMMSFKPWQSARHLEAYLKDVLQESIPSVFTMLNQIQEDIPQIHLSVLYLTVETYVVQSAFMNNSTPWRLNSLNPREFLLWQKAGAKYRFETHNEEIWIMNFTRQSPSTALRRGYETELPEELKQRFIDKGREHQGSSRVRATILGNVADELAKGNII